MNRTLAVILYGLLCGALLAAFTLITGLIKFIFSLGAFMFGLKFFGEHETWGVRFAFIGTTVLMFLIFILVYTVLAYTYDWPLPSLPEEP